MLCQQWGLIEYLNFLKAKLRLLKFTHRPYTISVQQNQILTMGGLKIVILHVIGPFVISGQVAEDTFDGVEDAIFEVIPDLG